MPSPDDGTVKRAKRGSRTHLSASRDSSRSTNRSALTDAELVDLDTTAALVRLVEREKPAAFDPSGHWVYILWGDFEKPVYIGETGDLLNRLGWHASNKRRHVWRVQLIPFDTLEQRKDAERRLIDFYQPLLNRPIGGYGKRRVPLHVKQTHRD